MNIRCKTALFLTVTGIVSLPLFTVMVYGATITAFYLNIEGLVTTMMLFGLIIATVIFIMEKNS